MTAAVGVGTIVAAATAVAYALLADELRAWLPHAARHLVRAAAKQLPPEQRDRYERDWLAELRAWEDRPVSALGKAFHIRLRARGIRESVLGVSLRGERLVRAMDVAVSLTMLFLFAPLLLAVALAIRLESRGPAFFNFARVGRDGEHFRLFKFRSMYVWRDLGWRRHHAMVDMRHPLGGNSDPRITRVGRIIRRWSLDELPQLLNVLRGEMSLVGPRPQYIPTRYDQTASEPDARTSVRPGMLDPGLAEVSPADLGGAEDLVERIRERQLRYVRSRSFLGDLRLLLLVPLVVYRRSASNLTQPGAHRPPRRRGR